MNYLLVSIIADPYKEESLEAQIKLVQVVMNVLTFGLLLSFAGVIIKKASIAIKMTSKAVTRTSIAPMASRVLREGKAVSPGAHV